MLTPASSRWRIKVCRRRIETRTRPSLLCEGRNRENGESLRAICADPAMPARATVFRWLGSNQEFRHLYVLARQCQAEDLADEILNRVGLELVAGHHLVGSDQAQCRQRRR
jgi:hypothetical protein